MPIPSDFLASLDCPHPKVIIDALVSKTNPTGCEIWALRDEVRPVDLYCYLWARFGPPNGFQNFLRKDDSDNLIHWDWALSCKHGWMIILGMNFRTEVQFVGCFPFTEADKDELIRQLKSDFANFGKQMSEKRKMLEKWVEFVNPYHRLRRAVDQLLKDLNTLSLARPEQRCLSRPN